MHDDPNLNNLIFIKEILARHQVWFYLPTLRKKYSNYFSNLSFLIPKDKIRHMKTK